MLKWVCFGAERHCARQLRGLGTSSPTHTLQNMGDYYQTAADLDADSQTAEVTVGRLRDWMISNEIIVPTESDCVLGRRHGYAPGKNYALAVEKTCSHLLELRTNGVVFIAERTVFYSAGSELAFICSNCGKKSGLSPAWSAAVDEWYEGSGLGILSCEHCGAKASIVEWQHDPPWAFGYAGVEFWNWPPLRNDFLNSLSKLVTHRIRLVSGKL